MRPSWDTYFMQICDLVSTRSTCDRKHVGAVIVKDKRIIATGYNGSLPELPGCNEIGHDMVNNHCVRIIHSETNAIYQAARMGIATNGTTIYCNTFPCWECFKAIVSAGIKEIIYKDKYGDITKVEQTAATLGVILRQYVPEHNEVIEYKERAVW